MVPHTPGPVKPQHAALCGRRRPAQVEGTVRPRRPVSP